MAAQRPYATAGAFRTALEAQLNEPYEVRFARNGDMFFVEMQSHLVRRVDSKTKIVSTIAGTGRPGFGGVAQPAIAMSA